MTVAEAVAALAARLAAAGVATPQVDAELLVAHVLAVPRAQLRHAAQPLPDAAAACIDELGARRARREPLQLIVGSVGFRYLDLVVRPGVFIPRPETEVLAGLAVERTPVGGVVVEPCTGTGAVACAVAWEAQPAFVVATDASADAVALARANADRLRVDVDVELGDLLEPVSPALRGRVDVLVSNPPYLADAELDGLEPEVRAWDPHDALVSGRSGQEAVARLIEAAPDWLRPGGWLLVELDPSRARDAVSRCNAAGLGEARWHPDLTGRARFVTARAPA